MSDTSSVGRSLQSIVEQAKEWKTEHVNIGEPEILGRLFVARLGQFPIVMDVLPGPALRNEKLFYPSQFLLKCAHISIIGIGADLAALTFDSYQIYEEEKLDRATRRRINRTIDKEYRGSMQLAFEAGRGKDLGISEAMRVVYLTRNGNNVPSIEEMALFYRIDGTEIDFFKDEYKGEIEKGNYGSNYQILIDAFKAPVLLNEAYEEWPKRWASIEPGRDPADAPGPEPEYDHVMVDIAVARQLSQNGAALGVGIPAGDRSDYMAAQMQKIAREMNGVMEKL